MNKTVIANWGHARKGKSSTVKSIAKRILQYYPQATSEPEVIDYTIDIKVIITIGKIKIGIESQGDPKSRLIRSLKEFAEINCQLILCSTRTSGSTVGAVNQLGQNNGYEIIWVTNYRSEEKDQDYLNNLSARQIFDLIQKSLLNEI